MIRRRSLLLVLLTLSCASSPTARVGEPLAVRSLFQSGGPFRDAAGQRVIQTTTALDALYAELNTVLHLLRPVTPADLDREVVVAAWLEVGNACLGVDVASAVRTATAVHVTVVETRPGPRCVCAELAWSPHAIAAIPRTGLPVVIEVERKQLRCD